MKILPFVLVLFLFVSCHSKNDITGNWMMHQVLQSGQDVTADHNPHGDRYIIFKADSTFESGGQPFGKNTGKYSYNATEGTLFLDSDTGPEDNSHWKVTLTKDTMHWQGYGSDWADAFEIINVRE
ncbi:lipocalin-like domain-containing protein [Mangrovibacterium diazotrophicum]|uniref:Lipocalin-like protein n=1 Tax=Mangrovibacterium diazotrophicum TaxID=1261403 RepID=A0A419WAB5_9BACT|nr:lipocalin family protein [Mangrovibacterium diazotrophicum]RKD92421.1 lipocalin-like protein [Mangrovibacterium diazotrophicum]